MAARGERKVTEDSVVALMCARALVRQLRRWHPRETAFVIADQQLDTVALAVEDAPRPPGPPPFMRGPAEPVVDVVDAVEPMPGNAEPRC